MELHGIGRRITSAGLMREELSSASDIIRNMDWAKGAGQAREAAHGLSNRLGILDAEFPKRVLARCRGRAFLIPEKS